MERLGTIGDDAGGAARREPGSAVGGTGASGQAGQVEGSYSEWCKSFERRKKSPPLEQLAALKTVRGARFFSRKVFSKYLRVCPLPYDLKSNFSSFYICRLFAYLFPLSYIHALLDL